MRAMWLVCTAGLALGGGVAAAESVGRSVVAQGGERAEGEPYVGISVRDTAEGVVVGWVFPGPAGGGGFTSTLGIRRGDNVDAVWKGDGDGGEGRVEIGSAAAFNEFVKGMTPGETLSIETRRSPEADHDGSVPRGGPGGEVTVYRVKVADRRVWTGTVGRGLGDREIAEAREGEFEAMLLELAGEVGALEAEGGLAALLENLRGVQESSLDANSLSAVVRSFRRPLSVDVVEGELAVLARQAAAGSLEHIRALIAHALDLPEYDGAALDEALAGVDLAQVRDDLRALVSWQRTNISVGGAGSGAQIRAINATEGTVGPYLAFLLHASETMLEWEGLGQAMADGAPIEAWPEDLAVVRAAVEGDVLHVERFPNGTIGVVGGPGPNRYDMTVITDVYDSGGNDTYTFGAADDSPSGGNHHIVDIAGDDLYESRAAFAGPAVGVMGMSIVDDRAGNDTYRSGEAFSIGAGLFGIGLLLDHGGRDTYENLGAATGWSTGVGYYGAGLVIDMAGDDLYMAEQLSQGVGGPRGLGAVVDGTGHDVYEMNGPHFGSVYGTPAVYKGFGQGFGIGVRSYAAGGLGAIWDFAGNDRYEAGEFAQGCAYYFAMGVLHDGSGNDIYIGNRYGQGSAAHQAIGMLIDDGGNDRYWSMTAASQAGVWDQSIAFLIDRAGDDRYSADGLAQGSASMQAVGVLIDLGGADAYLARGGATQGQGGSNTYHYDADGVFSFSALVDRGGSADVYSSGRRDGQTLGTGARNESDPSASTLFGVFSDE